MTYPRTPEDGDIRIYKRIFMRTNWRGDEVVERVVDVFQQFRGGRWDDIPIVNEVYR